MTVEPSAAFGEPTLILPGGETEPGEPHNVTANRELQEEIGYKARRQLCDALASAHPKGATLLADVRTAAAGE